MEQFVGSSQSGDLSAAVKGLSNPKLIMMIVSDKEVFAQKAAQLQQLFPNVPTIGCVGQSYSRTEVLEKGITVTAFCGSVTVETGVLTHVSTSPVLDIQSFQKHLAAIQPGRDNTVLIDFCSGNDECVLTTMQSVIKNKNISLTGGTAWEGLVFCNGVVYEDACAYAFVKNDSGKVKVYKENIYEATQMRHIVTKANPKEYVINELDGKPAEDVYTKELGLSEQQLKDQTFIHPLGRCIGNDIYIISIKEYRKDHSIECFRKANPKDIIYILKKGDHEKILDQTIDAIHQDFSHISGIFSVNCLFRYIYFQKNNFIGTYFDKMNTLGTHSGLIGLGEHFNTQHTNQTMSCVVFE